MINVQFVYGAGNDNWFGAALRGLRDDTIDRFGKSIYCPRIVDWTEVDTLNRLVSQWKDPTILVGHSCGCQSATRAAVANSMKRIPFLMAIAPSMYCSPFSITPNVKAACQASSWWGDFFNPGARMLLGVSGTNHVTDLSRFTTGLSHLNAPSSPEVKTRLFTEINLALKGA